MGALASFCQIIVYHRASRPWLHFLGIFRPLGLDRGLRFYWFYVFRWWRIGDRCSWHHGGRHVAGFGGIRTYGPPAYPRRVVVARPHRIINAGAGKLYRVFFVFLKHTRYRTSNRTSANVHAKRVDGSVISN